jgi:hypothetical protein
MRATGIERALTQFTRQHATTVPSEQPAQFTPTYVLSIQNTDLIEVTLRLWRKNTPCNPSSSSWRQKAILRLLLWKPLFRTSIDLQPKELRASALTVVMRAIHDTAALLQSRNQVCHLHSPHAVP